MRAPARYLCSILPLVCSAVASAQAFTMTLDSGTLVANSWHGSPPIAGCNDTATLSRGTTRREVECVLPVPPWNSMLARVWLFGPTVGAPPDRILVETFAASDLVGTEPWGGESRADVVIELTSPAPTASHVGIGRSLFAQDHTTAVDVGMDGTAELTSPDFTASVWAVLTPSPLRVSIAQAQVSPPTFGTRHSYVQVDVQSGPTAAKLRTHLSPCQADLGGYLYRDGTSTHFHFVAHSSSTTAVPFFVIGLSRVNIPIPPTNCVLGTDIVIPVLSTFANGDPVLDFTVNFPLQGPIYVQFLTGEIVSGVEYWHTSNLLEIVLP